MPTADEFLRTGRTAAEFLGRQDTVAPPTNLFDPISSGISPVQALDFSQISPQEREEVRRRIIANPPIQSGLQKALGGIDRASEIISETFPELTQVSEVGRTLVRGGVQLASLPGVAIESLALPATAIGEEEAGKSFGPIPPSVASRGRVVGSFLRDMLRLVGQVPTQTQRALELFVDPESKFQPTKQEDVPLILQTLVELQRQTIGEPTTEKAQLRAVKSLEEEPESLLFGFGIGKGLSGGGAKLTKRLQKVKERPPTRFGETPEVEPSAARIEEPKTPLQVSEQALKVKEQAGVTPDTPTKPTDISTGRFGGVKVTAKTTRIEVPEARPKSDLQAQASSPIEVGERFLAVTRERKARIYESSLKADKWEKNFKEVEREDAGALVEGIDNIRTGKPPKSTDKTRRLAREFGEAIGKQRKDINNYLRNLGQEDYIGFIENYIPHFFADNAKVVKTKIKRWILESPNAKRRLLPTLKEAIELGLTPLSQDVSLLYRMYADINWRVAANKQVAELFQTAKNADGTPIASKKPVPEWEKFNHPALAQIFGTEKGVWIHPDVRAIAKQAFDDPLASRGKIGKAFDNINAAAKHGELLLSGFHAIALAESGQAVLARGKNPFRGLFMAGRDAQRLSDKSFILSFRAGKRFQEANPEVVMDFIRDGLELRTASADIGAGILSRSLKKLEVKVRTKGSLGRAVSHFPRKLRQGIDLLNKGLWEQIHEGYKIASHYDILQRELPRIPDSAPARVRQKVRETIAEGINDAFGGQEWESKFWLTPQGLQYARRSFLAPDWTLSNLRIAGRGLKNIKNPVERRMWLTYWRNMSLSVGATIQAMNYWSTGHFTWDNEINHKLDIDYTKLRRKIDRVLGRKSDKQRHYVRIAKQAREVLSWFQDPLRIAGSKASPLVRETFKQATGHQAGSGFQAEWTREKQQFWESIPNRIKSMANLFTPFSLRGNQFAFSLPASRGMTNFKAIQAFQKALDAKEWVVFGKHVQKQDAIREIAQAAKDNGLDVKQLFTAAMGSVRGKYYDRYFKALEDENFKKAHEVALILKDLGATEKTINQSAKRRGLIE